MKKKNFIKIAGLCVRYLWALPVSVFGIVLLPFVILSGGAVVIAEGAIEAEGPLTSCLFSRLHIDAIAIGHVVFGLSRDSLIRCRNHERVHVRQYERWGPLFPFLYLLASSAALIRGLHPYRDNRFEQEAFRVSGLMETLRPQGPGTKDLRS
jgi:hypothetical protein